MHDENISARAASPRRVLVVDDNVDAASSLQCVLGLEGFDAAMATSGIEALALARSFVPHVIVLDLRLADMDGGEVARQLRARPTVPGQVLIAATGMAAADCADALRHFDHYLCKPLSIGALCDLMRESAPAMAQTV